MAVLMVGTCKCGLTFRVFTAIRFLKMSCYISWRDVTYTGSLASVVVHTVTDSASHLWLRWSAKEPQIHKKQSNIRGLLMMDDYRFCFTVFQDVQQNESGDTYVHTFTLSTWAYCQTRWFYMWGKKAALTCVSTSPLFKFHNNFTMPANWNIGYPPYVAGYGYLSNYAYLDLTGLTPYAGTQNDLTFWVQFTGSYSKVYVALCSFISGSTFYTKNVALFPIFTSGYFCYSVGWPIAAGDYLAFYMGDGGMRGAAGTHTYKLKSSYLVNPFIIGTNVTFPVTLVNWHCDIWGLCTP